MAGKYQRKRKKNPLMTVLVAVLSVVVLILALAGIYVVVLMDQVNYQPGGETLSSSQLEELLNRNTEGTIDPTAQVVDPGDVTWNTEPVSELANSDVLTILLIGQDRRPGEPIARSDAMILCTLNRKTGELTLTSLMRDMYVPIPGYAPNRINVCYLLGGMQLLKDCIKHNFGVVVDGCVEVDFDGFVDVVELMGGVEVELSAREAQHLNDNEAYYDYPNESWNLQEGKNLLDGKQALAYSRVRNIGNSDFGRTERQRKVLGAMLEKVKTMNLAQLNDLLMTAAGLVTTDMSRTDLLGCAMSVIPMLGNLQMNSLQIPAGDAYYDATIEGIGMVLVPDMEKNRALLAELYE